MPRGQPRRLRRAFLAGAGTVRGSLGGAWASIAAGAVALLSAMGPALGFRAGVVIPFRAALCLGLRFPGAAGRPAGSLAGLGAVPGPRRSGAVALFVPVARSRLVAGMPGSWSGTFAWALCRAVPSVILCHAVSPTGRRACGAAGSGCRVRRSRGWKGRRRETTARPREDRPDLNKAPRRSWPCPFPGRVPRVR